MSLAVMPTSSATGGLSVDEVTKGLLSFTYTDTRLPDEAFLSASASLQATATVGHELATSNDACEALTQMAHALQLPEKDVCAAAGVKARTVEGWKRHGYKPQVRSLGRLWNMVEVVNGLNEELEGSFPQWLKATHDRLALFRSGEFNELVNLVAEERLTNAEVIAPYAPIHTHDPDISTSATRHHRREPLEGLKRERL